MILSATDQLQPGDLVRIGVSLAGLRPSDADMQSALVNDGFSVARVETPLFGGATDVWLRVDLPMQAGELGKRVAESLDRHFLLVVDADAVGYEKVSSLPTGPPRGGLDWIADLLRLAIIAGLVLIGWTALKEVRS